ncbi:HAMP domain-containing sensor histidine kinase [Paenibacillus chitinolyticus]|uniref:HAMP domain-containing sensor histidine kinase n=1 Tax=Paenibacillus chitinolyticus TaxID=79263 RepID=UPI002DB82D75|nr:HAMP domain-containing sensor histidine kinase [Paenibacillus chitinolyticus]MEC0247716.1 HAMP domain-containing sensor histidine kinase [Paenibacillus chitinolyticus]
MSSIRSKVVWNFLLIIVFIVLLLGGLFLGTIYQYYYGSALQALSERAKFTVDYNNRYNSLSPLQERARNILKELAKDEISRVEVLDLEGNLIRDSYGFTSKRKIDTSDVQSALLGEPGKWIGLNTDTKERIMALSYPLKNGDRVVGVLRYTTSIEQVDRMVMRTAWIIIGIGVAVILVSLAVSLLLANRIVRPIREVTDVAQSMAQGDFHNKAVKRHDDEVGHLADTLNYMADEILRNDRLKNEFISSISHELRTPLTSIKGWSETLVSGDLNEKEETLTGLSVISKETDRLIGLVEDLLDFSKLQSGNMKMHREPVDVNRLVKDIYQQFAGNCQRRRMELQISLAENSLYVFGDQNRLKQVLINLLDNAMKFTQENGVIRIMTRTEGSLVQLIVEDEGEGISPEAVKYVTEKFYKADNRQPGSGLGLSICQEIAQLHGGTLQVTSELGQGTTVTVELPRMPEEEKVL